MRILLGFAMLSLAVATAVCGRASADWVQADSYPTFDVLVADTASASEKLAAEKFREYWKATTGHEIPVGSAPGDGITVWIGRQGLPEPLLGKLKLDGLGDDGFHIRTVRRKARGDVPFPGKHLLIVGGPGRGTLYGVYEFFERYMGVRWLTADFTHIPDEPPQTLPRINYRFSPPFEWREASALHDRIDNSEFRRACKLTDSVTHGFGGHTFYMVVPPEDHFEEHPEYYSLINGKRTALPTGQIPFTDVIADPELFAQAGQLCCSNPEVAEVAARRIIRLITTPANELDEYDRHCKYILTLWETGKIHSVSQMDWANNCQCDACKAIDEREGTTMGSVLTMVNRIAEIVERELPGHMIHTFAYTYAAGAPKHLKPRHNVVVQFCSIHCDFSRPFRNRHSEINREFMKDLKKWSKITDQLYMWDYMVNFANPIWPHPNLHVIQPNMKTFADHGVRGMFAQSWPHYMLHVNEFRHLRAYLTAKAIWDPECDIERHMTEFLELFYGPAAPQIREYIDLTTDRIIANDRFYGCFSAPDWFDTAMVLRAQDIFAEAFAAVASDPVLTDRVARAYVPMQFAALVCPPDITIVGDQLVLKRPPSQTLEEYVAMLEDYGETDQPGALSFPIQDARNRAREATVPRDARCKILKIENDHVALWVVPELCGAVIRWLVKDLDAELLRGYEHFGRLPTIWREYTHTPPIGQPIATSFDVIEHTADAITLEADMDNGLTVVKRLALSPDSNEIEFSPTMRNNSNKAVVPLVKSVPEFYTQGSTHPEVWVELDGAWSQMNPETAPSRLEMLPEASYTRLAARFPDAELTLVSTFTPGEARPLLFAYRAEDPYNQLNLDVLPNQVPLEPRETRTATVRYSLTRNTLNPLK